MNFNLYRAEDFAADETFVAYYLKNDEQAVVFWKNWISLHPEKLDEVDQAERLLDKLHLRLNQLELEDAYQKFNAFVDSEVSAQKPRPIVKSFNIHKISIAASLFLICSISLYLFITRASQEDLVTHYNGYGKTSIITLEDGTKISLNSNSSVSYPKHFSKTKREVHLEGEGFFEVAKDKKRPFTVTTAKLTTTVLGTKFNVSAYRNIVATAVALVEGSVSVQLTNNSSKIILKPTEMASINSSEQKIKRTVFDVEKVTSWQTGHIIFDNASFDEVAAKLFNAYGITVINHTGHNDWKYSGNFDKTEYLSIIKNICFAKRLNYETNQKTIILKP